MRGAELKSLQYIICVALVLLIGSCEQGQKQSAIPAGSPKTEWIHFQFAVYYLPVPKQDPQVVVRNLLDGKYRGLRAVENIPEKPGEMVVRAYRQYDVQESYRPPDKDHLRYFGHGIGSEQADLLQASEQVLILDFAHPSDDVWAALRTAAALTEQVARETDGLIWDEETREIFSPDEWHDERLSSWTYEVPDISKHTVIHSYKSGEFIRAITLGMVKFGLPDIVVEEFSWSNNRSMGHLINLFGQAMAEGASIEEPGEFDLDLKNIGNPDVRQPQMESLKPNATAVALLGVKQGTWEEGDPNNRLIQITFERYRGPDMHARQDELLSSLFGWEDAITRLTHTDELLAASRAAKAELPTLRRAFNEGLEPGEYILLKAPFATPDGGQEWMWVEVFRWQGKEIKGLLMNEPFDILGLHAGQKVTVNQQDIFDYIRKLPDGTQVGNETGKIIQRMNQEKAQ